MLRTISVERFKSLVKLDLELGRINVFVGANGSGKSNLLEAVGVLGAAASGRVDDEALLHRGVRPGVPTLYKSAFPSRKRVPHIRFAATSAAGTNIEVTMWFPPGSDPSAAWRFKTEKLTKPDGKVVVSRGIRSGKHNQEQGLIALKMFEFKPDDPAHVLVDQLRTYSIHCPNTPSLRGLVQDVQTREPVGLAGGRLPEAIQELLAAAEREPRLQTAIGEVRQLIDWSAGFSAVSSTEAQLSPSAARSRLVIQFQDRFMAADRATLTGYDASEGALYILYCAVLALHPKAPKCLAIDNVDQTLNPKLAERLMTSLCSWVRKFNGDRQWLLTVQNPAVLDGIPLTDKEVRLFAVDRDSNGHTVVNPIRLGELEAAREKQPDWPLSRMWMNGLLGGMPNV